MALKIKLPAQNVYCTSPKFQIFEDNFVEKGGCSKRFKEDDSGVKCILLANTEWCSKQMVKTYYCTLISVYCMLVFSFTARYKMFTARKTCSKRLKNLKK